MNKYQYVVYFGIATFMSLMFGSNGYVWVASAFAFLSGVCLMMFVFIAAYISDTKKITDESASIRQELENVKAISADLTKRIQAEIDARSTNGEVK